LKITRKGNICAFS